MTSGSRLSVRPVWPQSLSYPAVLGSPEKQNQLHLWRSMWKEVHYRNGLMWLWRWRSPMICRLQITEWGKQVVQVNLSSKHKNQGSQCCEFLSESKGLRTMNTNAHKAADGCPSSSKKQICPTFTFSFHSVPQKIGWCPPTLVRVICTQYTDSNANLYLTHLHRYTQKWCFTSYPGIP